jgi:TetR/AcrR family transcriptional regulator, transcriptional repressor for nem operon
VLGTLALMVGGMILARATKGTALSDEILSASRSYGAAALREFVSRSSAPDDAKQEGDGK